jgi:hypothetical protein
MIDAPGERRMREEVIRIRRGAVSGESTAVDRDLLQAFLVTANE